ncbi:hypothetical protein LCGC14_1532870 [marine sediment metagenome]|uniref:Methyltransferase type 11 domain-containing protein n=1 Tax=marine sediment metagenome TaxID=412755 RepID=A0A0F9IVI7_9ZZZZ
MEETTVRKPRKAIKGTRTPKLPIYVNRTMDLKMLDTREGTAFVVEFMDFQTQFMKLNKGIAYHIDGPDNPFRRYWEYWWTTKYMKVRQFKGTNILEAGCGNAIFQFFLLHIYKNVEVMAIDDGSQSPNFENYCSKAVVPLGFADRYDCEKTDIRKMSILDDEIFEHIFCISVIEHIPEDEQALAELCRVLAPGGTMGLTFDFHKDEFPERKDRLYTLKDIERLVRKAKECGVSLMYNSKFNDMTDWDNPPVRLGEPPDHNYNFGSLFFTKK